LPLQSDPNPSAPTPDHADVYLTWNGVQQDRVRIALAGLPRGAVYELAVQVANPVTATGAYDWSARVTVTRSDGTTPPDATASGTAFVVVRDNSPVGAGWGIDGIPQLVPIGATAQFPAGGLLWVTGAGDSRFFQANPDGTFSNAEDFGTLVALGTPATGYTYTAKDRTVWTFNAQGQLLSVVDPHQLARTYTYDDQGRLRQVSNPDGGVATFGYTDAGATGKLSTITEPGTNRVVTVQISNGNLTQLTDVDSTLRGFGYDSTHHLTNDQWAPLNATFSYDSMTGLLANVDRGLNTTYTIVPTASQGLSGAVVAPPWASVTDHRSNTSRYLLDNRGRLLVQNLPGPTGTPDSVSSYQRDEHGQVTVAVDALGTPTFYAYVYGTYDPLQYGGAGDLIRVASADGSVRRYCYDPTFHQLTRATDGLFGVRTNTYDPVTGDRLSSSDWAVYTSHYSYYPVGDAQHRDGLLATAQDALGQTTTYLYDSHRRVQAVIDPLGNWTVTSYDNAGNPATVRDALGRVTTTVYNGRNQLLATVDANGGVTSQVYLPDGQLRSQTNARGFTTTTTYDQRGFAVAVTDALNHSTLKKKRGRERMALPRTTYCTE
jgi:YD repeat-containing protein